MSAQPKAPTAQERSERVAAALGYVSSDDREVWVRMAFALKSELGEDGFGLWDEWSRKSKAYDLNAARSVWKSARADGKVTIATLYFEAKQNGFDAKESLKQKYRATEVHDPKSDEVSASKKGNEEKAALLALSVYTHAAGSIGDKKQSPHPYLVRKKLPIDAAELDCKSLKALLGYTPKNNGEPLEGRILVLAVRDKKEMTSLEFIDEKGRKSALYGGRKAGCWIQIEKAETEKSPIYVAEGYATAMSIAMHTRGAQVVAAMSNTNLHSVSQALRRAHTDSQITVCADIDSVEQAKAAAQAVGGRCIAPTFRQRVIGEEGVAASFGKKGLKDFNDMMVVEGKDFREELNKILSVSQERVKHQEIAEPGMAEQHVLPSSWQTSGLATGIRKQFIQRRSEKMETSVETKAETGQMKVDAETGEITNLGKAKRPSAGKNLMELKDIPLEIRDVAKSQFGARTNIYTPRENGGPYNGEVYNTDKYMIQELGPRSVVIHDKKNLEFVSDKLKWMDDNKKLNTAELMIVYEGDKAKAYPHDVQRDKLKSTVASLKKSAKELGMGEDITKTLDVLQEKSWERVKGIRREEASKQKDKELVKKVEGIGERQKETPAAPKR